MIIMAKCQAKTKNKTEENMKVAQSKLSSIAEQSITNGQYWFLTYRLPFLMYLIENKRKLPTAFFKNYVAKGV